MEQAKLLIRVTLTKQHEVGLRKILSKKKIEEVSGILNIKLDFLRLIEAGELSKIENNIYSRGHIRTYLDWLEVDPQPLLNFINQKEEKKNRIKNQQNYFKIHKLTISKKYIILIFNNLNYISIFFF